MVSGHLREKNNRFYMVLNYTDFSGKRITKWISTGLPVKGNKKRAENLLAETRMNYEVTEPTEKDCLLFADFMKEWLKSIKPNIEESTYSSYEQKIGQICRYFGDRAILLKDLETKDIQAFYTFELSEMNVSANTVVHFHANIRKALQFAVKMELIPANPALNVERPKIKKFVGKFYDVESINQLLEVVKGTKIQLAVMLAAFYGLRRGEILGLRWNSIDFKNKNITINHTVYQKYGGGKSVIVAKDRAKTKSSLRTLPLVPEFEAFLSDLKKNQAENRRVCGKCYNHDYDDYVYVDEMGNLIKPDYISLNFKMMLRKNKLVPIRFHDLRHSCASLLLANGVSLKEIQDWLGHSDFSTTANIYAHLDKTTKTNSAIAMRQSGIRIDVNLTQ